MQSTSLSIIQGVGYIEVVSLIGESLTLQVQNNAPLVSGTSANVHAHFMIQLLRPLQMQY